MQIKMKHIFITGFILSVTGLTAVKALTDAELEALEKQIEQQEAENQANAAAEAKRKAEAKRQAQEAAREKAEEQRRAEDEARKKAEIEAKRKTEQEAERNSSESALTLEMVKIPGGTFQMGLNDSEDEARPVHHVSISTFAMGKHEVTVGQFQEFVEATGYRTDAEKSTDGKNGCYTWINVKWHWKSGTSWQNPAFSQMDNHPVVCVSWNDVQGYIDWLNRMTSGNYRLPSEAEWEYVCRSGGRQEKYCGGNDADVLAWYDGNSDNKTHPVGQKQPNGLGLYDMSGNVWEWVEDCWNKNYSGAPGDGSAWTSGDCSRRMGRGGSWYASPGSTHSAHRSKASRTISDNGRGFRLARDL